jgi:hypothetical protein
MASLTQTGSLISPTRHSVIFTNLRQLVNDTGNANAMADAVFYNSLAWAINGSEHYEQNVVRFIDYWFLNPDTYMLPNLDYAQMLRGPNGQTGAHTGLLYAFKYRANFGELIVINQRYEMHGQGGDRYHDPPRGQKHLVDVRYR